VARLPQSFIDELVSRVDIVELIDARVPLKKKGRDYMACCPFHGEKTPSFSVSPQKQFYHCFGCGAHGTALGFLIEYERLEFLDAVRMLAEMAGVPMPEVSGGKPEGPTLAPLYAQLDEATALYKRLLKDAPRAIEYLKQRGVSGEIAAEFALGYAPDAWDTAVKALGHDEASRENLITNGLAIKRDDNSGSYDRFRDRVMFPIRDARGRVIGFGGRILDQGEPKYLNSPETPLFHKGRELYGLFEARQAERNLERLLVVEGYMDVIALAQHGVRNAVATLGTSTTPEHLTRLFRVVPEVVFCFDGDKAGRAAAWRALENALGALADGREVRFLFLPEGDDPDTLVRREGQDGFQQRLGKSQPLSQYLIDHLREQVDLATLEGRAKLADLAKPLIARIPESVFRTLITDRIAELTRVAARDIARPAPSGGRDRPRFGDPDGPRGAGRAPAVTPVRKALALALLQPSVTATTDPAALRLLGQPGLELLAELCEFFRDHPGATAATVVMHWAGTERGATVEKLLTLPLEVPEDGVAAEFEGLVADLTRQTLRHRRQALEARLEEVGYPGLSQAEKDEYSALIRAERKELPGGQNT